MPIRSFVLVALVALAITSAAPVGQGAVYGRWRPSRHRRGLDLAADRATPVRERARGAVVPAAADGPTFSTNAVHLGPLVDDETCSFPVTFALDQTREVTTFANGDAKRHVTVTALQAANGHTATETDTFDVFIDHSDPNDWKITGRFTQIHLDGRLLTLQSGLISFDPTTGDLTDPRPGPLGATPDSCAILAP
jgi:hypothetical protein